MPTLIISLEAQQDLALLFDHLAREAGASIAVQSLQRIRAALDMLAEMPRLGRVRDDYEGRPRSFSAWPWIVIYDVQADPPGVFVLRVIDGRRDVPRHIR